MFVHKHIFSSFNILFWQLAETEFFKDKVRAMAQPRTNEKISDVGFWGESKEINRGTEEDMSLTTRLPSDNVFIYKA